MSLQSVAELVEALREGGLLDASQLKELTETLAQAHTETSTLAADLTRRGWLTDFQAEKLLQGKAKDLVLGPYVLLARVGQGGMGEVFKARHRLLSRVVALKITKKELLTDPTSERRFLREIQATARLAHPNIVTVHDAARIDDTQFFAMEYIEGADLGRIVKENGPLPIPRACDYIRQAALGLQHAFEQGLVHRDIKPSNLLVTADGGQVKILDMGVVRFADTDGSDLTATGAVVGTPDYLAPEQATNSRAVDTRADLYSLGCTLYHLLTGRPPFPEGSALEKVLKHLHDPPSSIQKLRPDVPADLAAVLEKLLAKKPDQRFQKPKDVVDALTPFCQSGPSSPVEAAPPKPSEKPKEEPPPRRSRRRALATVVIVLLLAGIGLAGWHPWKGDPNPDWKPPMTNSIGMELVWVPAGEFTMGAPTTEPGRQEDEGPTHQVVITRSFYLASHETTARQFESFAHTTSYKTEAEQGNSGSHRWSEEKHGWELDRDCTWKRPGALRDANHPVVCVSRSDAEAFCYWLSKKENRTYRLPTEAEWEYACRAGSTTAFSVGPSLAPDQARFFSGKELRRTVKVGTHSSNAWGLHDMHGNVWEWCTDYYRATYYRDSPPQDPRGPQNSDRIVARGGSWSSRSSECRSAARLAVSPSMRRNDIGFRVLLEAGVR
jgi:formylglycine-generating enzyme required for sulfatase activity/tRNA A-37 threonylcarbamoyl transferase component Bud32